MKIKSFFITLVFTILIPVGFLNAEISSGGLALPDDGYAVNSQIKVYLSCSFDYDINSSFLTVSYDPGLLAIDSGAGNKGVMASVKDTLLQVDNSVSGKMTLELNGIGCSCMFSYYSLSFITLKTGISPIDCIALTDPNLITTGNIELKIVNYGDVNGDTFINIIDSLLIARKYVEFEVDPFIEQAADVNGDKSVNIVDALLIAQLYVKQITDFPLPVPTIQPTIEPTAQPSPSCFFICGGDVDGNGSRNLIDAFLLHRYIVGWNTPGFIIEEADVNGNGIIDSDDACLICYYE